MQQDFVKKGKKVMKSVQNYSVIRCSLKLKYKSDFKDIYAMSVFAWFHNGATKIKINSYIFSKCSFDKDKLDKKIDSNVQFFSHDKELAPSGKKDANIGVFPLLDYMLKNAGKETRNV